MKLMLPAAITSVFRNNSLAAKIFLHVLGGETKTNKQKISYFNFLVVFFLSVTAFSSTTPILFSGCKVMTRHLRVLRDTFQRSFGQVPSAGTFH